MADNEHLPPDAHLLDIPGLGTFEVVQGVLAPAYLKNDQGIHDQPPLTLLPVPEEWFTSPEGWPRLLRLAIASHRPFTPYNVHDAGMKELLLHLAEPMRSWEQLNLMRDQVHQWFDQYPGLEDYLRGRWRRNFQPNGMPIARASRPNVVSYGAHAARTIYQKVPLAVWIGDGEPPGDEVTLREAAWQGGILFRLIRRVDERPKPYRSTHVR